MHERLVVAVAAQHDRRLARRGRAAASAAHAASGRLPRSADATGCRSTSTGIGGAVHVRARRGRTARRARARSHEYSQAGGASASRATRAPASASSNQTRSSDAHRSGADGARSSIASSRGAMLGGRARRVGLHVGRARRSDTSTRANGFGMRNRSQLFSRHARDALRANRDDRHAGALRGDRRTRREHVRRPTRTIGRDRAVAAPDSQRAHQADAARGSPPSTSSRAPSR